MSNKITCTCGHSWNKSSSSKKDMRICHICGKDNTMKNGGWLDAYGDVPQAQLGISTSDNTFVKKPIIKNPIGGPNDPDVMKYNEVKKDEQWKDPYTFLMNWYTDPETKKRLKAQGAPETPMTEALNQKRYNNYDDWRSDSRDKNRKDAEAIWKNDYSKANEFTNFLNQSLDSRYDDLIRTSSGFHDAKDSTVALSNFGHDRTKENMNVTAVHELTHATPLDNFYIDYFKKNKPKDAKWLEEDYFSKNPVEIYPRIQDLRYQMQRDKKIAPGTKITPSLLEGYNNNSDLNLRNYYSPEELSKIMNEVAYAPNVNNPIRQAQNGIEASTDGFTDQGFNYNGAWGGTMQYGGDIPKAQNGLWNTNKTQWVDSIHNARRGDLDFVNRYFDPSAGSIPTPRDVEGWKPGQTSTHLMAYDPGSRRVYPQVVNANGKLQYMPGDQGWNYADDTKQFIEFPTAEQAAWYSSNGYKKGTNVLKGKTSAPKKAMGGNIPGSVGFSYARTQGIPDNGPYAKKTMASAQDGEVVEYKELPEIVVVGKNNKSIKKREDFEPWWNWASKKAGDVDNRQDAFGTLGDLYAYYAGQPLHYNTLEHSQYKPTNAKNPNANYISINDPKFKQEIFDKYQDVFIKGKLKTADVNKGEHLWNNEEKINDSTYAVSGYTRPTKEELEEARKQKVSPAFIKGKNHVSNAIGRYFISKGKDDKGEYISYYDVFDEGSGPDGGGMGETLGLTKPFEIYDRIYLDPKTGKPKFQNGGEMSFYQNGLDWTPRNISKNGSEITKDDNGYWNPENWGKPVEIGSNNITMQGVNEPLIGISDTGDTQMMYPGEDYKFDGESVTEYPVAQNGKKVKIPMSDFKKMGNNYQDSVNTYDYTGALWDAVRTRNSSAVDKAISDNANLVKNTSNIKPTSYDAVTVGGKNYRIPEYNFPQMDPWENYEPVSGFWDNVGSKLSGISNTIGKTAIGKSMQKIDNKIDEGVKKIWRKFTEDDAKTNVQNQGATSAINKQPVQVKKQSAPPKTTSTPPVVSKPKPKPASKPTIEPRAEQPTKSVTKTNPPPIIEKRQNIYEGSPVYSGSVGSGTPSALVGFENEKGEVTYIQPEDYQRYGVPTYGKEYIESKTASKKKKNGGDVPKAQLGKTVPPLYVSNPRDPRLRAYQDSLVVFNTDAILSQKLKNAGYLNFTNDAKGSSPKQTIKRHYGKPSGDKMGLVKISNSLYKLKDYYADVIDDKYGSQYLSTNIEPKGVRTWGRFITLDGDMLPSWDYRKTSNYENAKPVQPVIYKKPEQEVVLNPPSNVPKKPQPKPQPVKKKPTPQPKPVQEQPIKKTEPPKPVEVVKQNVYEGSPVYSNMLGSGDRSALVGFANPKGDTTYIKPEDYQRYGVPAYGKEYIESKTKKKKNGGWLDKYN